MNGKKITFNGDLDNFKTKDKGVTIQIKTITDSRRARKACGY